MEKLFLNDYFKIDISALSIFQKLKFILYYNLSNKLFEINYFITS